jgi:molybdenum cofactor synthesis domain-containing protein
MPTAAALIIGNEILSGKFQDENGPFLITRLRSLGCDLNRLVVLPDDHDDIAREVARCSEAFDVVITTGGVGPTHDDITLESIAQAFQSPLVLEPKLLELLVNYGLPDNDATRRMVRIPEDTELVWSEGLTYPVLVVRNVYVFPGVPKLMRAKFENVSHRFAGQTVDTARLYVTQGETEIAHALSVVQDAFPTVDIGSYPRWGEGPFRVIVTLESRDATSLRRAEADLRDQLDCIDPT